MIFPPLSNDVKMLFTQSQSSHLLSSRTSTWAGKLVQPINPSKCACRTVGNLPPLSPSFFAADTDHRIPHVTDARDLWVPRDTTFTASAHCIEAANTTRRLLFLVRRSFCELSKTALTPIYCALARPQLKYVMKANAPTLRAEKNHFERVQRFPTLLVRGLRHVSYEERLRHLSLFSVERRRLRADLIRVFNIFSQFSGLLPRRTSLIA